MAADPVELERVEARALAMPNSGASGTVEWIRPIVVPSCGAWA